MADAIQSFLATHEQSDPTHIPLQRPQCCCGNEACAYLKHNQSALDGLERDVSTAARLGKALLMRHEAYIADSERERKAMTAQIETLEAEKLALERRNAVVIEENRSLLDHLEAVNSAAADSDAHVLSLQATLQSTQQELQKLAHLATRTEVLEQQLVDFEREQASWQSSLDAKEETEKSAVRRWQKAERTLGALQEEIERIEREAKEEKERHADIVGRMERRHAVEKELGNAAGRLKGAAALKGNGSEAGEPNVVSHFVKDILQDNANLQMGIVELREMLNNSNDEVEDLRQQIQLHQPADKHNDLVKTPVTRKDLGAEMVRANSQELHVHHHYHAPPTAPKPTSIRKPKKKRYSPFTAGQSTPTSGTSTPRSSFSYSSPTPTATILQQTAASVPQPVPSRKRWSSQSSQTYHSLPPSSGPSSPQSTTNRTSSIYDRVFSDAGHDSSRPTTPETEDPGSPFFAPAHTKRASIGSFRTHSAPVVQRGGITPSSVRPSLDAIMSVEELPNLELDPIGPDAIIEEDETEWVDEHSPVRRRASITSPMSEGLEDQTHGFSYFQQPLRRAASHESLLSVSGMDIHTLKTRPSQLLAPYGGRGATSQAVISDATAHVAQSSAMSRPTATSRSLLSGMAADQRQQASNPTIGKKIGGWVFGRWGATPAPTAAAAAVSTPASVPKAQKPGSISSASDKAGADLQATPKKAKLRLPGINQSGPIQGLFSEVKTQHAPVLKSLDQEALRNVLDG